MQDNRTVSENLLNAEWLFNHSVQHLKYTDARRWGKEYVDYVVQLSDEADHINNVKLLDTYGIHNAKEHL